MSFNLLEIKNAVLIREIRSTGRVKHYVNFIAAVSVWTCVDSSRQSTISSFLLYEFFHIALGIWVFGHFGF